MTKLKYIDKKFSPESELVIAQSDQIISEYERQGFSLTLRQLFYQHVARGYIENSTASYNRLGNIMSDARLAGLISWTAIEDRGRNLRGLNFHRNPQQAIQGVAINYRIDMWKDQLFRPEVWIEKEALVGVIGGICNSLRVDYFACKGYNSQSEQWRAGQRFASYIGKGYKPIVFHLGDHDPSGLDMTRDNFERLRMFVGHPVPVQRLALNFDQVQAMNLPPNPAKVTDSRFEAYRRRFGEESWELDALSPAFISNLISEAINGIIDKGAWDESLRAETEDRRYLEELAEGDDHDFD